MADSGSYTESSHASSTTRDGGIIERILDSPRRTKEWWANLSDSFDPKFLYLITGVYFLQGLGGFGVRPGTVSILVVP